MCVHAPDTNFLELVPSVVPHVLVLSLKHLAGIESNLEGVKWCCDNRLYSSGRESGCESSSGRRWGIYSLC
jgi:hypothetical protein